MRTAGGLLAVCLAVGAAGCGSRTEDPTPDDLQPDGASSLRADLSPPPESTDATQDPAPSAGTAAPTAATGSPLPGLAGPTAGSSAPPLDESPTPPSRSAPGRSRPSSTTAAPPAAPSVLPPFDDTGTFPVSRRDGVVYGEAPGPSGDRQSLLLDLYSPVGDAGRRHPAVVFAHGGGFTGGSRAEGSAVLRDLARRGYVGASIDYRVDASAAGVTYPLDDAERARVDAAVSDLKSAVRWIRAHAAELAVDPDRIAVMGSSAGAVMALTAALTPQSPGDGSGELGFSSAVCTAVSVMGASDAALADPGDAGALLVHGTADRVVPYAVATQTEAAMRSAGLATELVSVSGRGHDLVAGSDLVLAAATPWLREHLARTTAPCR